MEGNIKVLDFTIDDSNAQEGAIELLKIIRPQWKSAEVQFQVFTEGITNKLIGCYYGTKDNMLVVRIYGAGSDVIIDRYAEKFNMQLLHSIGCAGQLYASFKNGLVYEFVHGECLDEKTVRDPHISSLVAKAMVQIHNINSDYVAKHSINISTTPVLFTRLRQWISKAPDTFDEPARKERLSKEVPNKAALLKEVDLLEQHLVPLNSPVSFTHNDLLLKNIVHSKEKDTCTFIDYEYGSFNYSYFDIGNHFCEFAGIDEVDYNLYPNREFQLPWLRRYLEHEAHVQGKSKTDVSDRDVENLYVKVNKFALAAHFGWGLWGLIQALHSNIDFDYLDYAIVRLNEYFKKKEEFLAL